MVKTIRNTYSFDDVLLVPRYNTIASRSDPDIDLSSDLAKQLKISIPFVSSCMDTVTEDRMAAEMWKNGGLGVVHRYNTIEKQVGMAKQIQQAGCKAAFAVGANGDAYERLSSLYDVGVNIFCIDIAHGDSTVMGSAISRAKKLGKDIVVIAGNVATPSGALFLADHGADSIRVGIGGGSMCTTRLVTGFGIPTLQSILDIRETDIVEKYGVSLIADGGIRNSGDAVKSFVAGAHAVMLGQALAGTDESPGEVYEMRNSGLKYKLYRGMASFDAQVEWRPEKRTAIVPEGDAGNVLYKGKTKDVLHGLVGGVRSGMTYANARSLRELHEYTEIVGITHAGLIESKPHAKFNGV